MVLLKNAARGLALVAVVLANSAGLHAQSAGGERPPTAVTVVTVQPAPFTLTTTLPGRVVASVSAEVRPQVAGLITKRHFREGSRVEEGDVLYTIDPASYEARLAQAEAGVAQAEAQLRAAQAEAERIAQLQERNIASQQVGDDAVAARDSAAAALQLANAQVQSARIELDRTTITAPLSGEIGLARTNQGALVTASQPDPLAVIRRIDPIFVDVTQSAAEFLAWRRGHTELALGSADRQVSLILADGTIFDQTGTLTAAEPYVDAQTGVVVLRMEFANPDKFLLPGMYVQVKMPTGVEDGIFSVPQEGVSRDRRGRPVAMIVTADNMVEERMLTIAGDQGAFWLVRDGLDPGDRVVVEGLQKIGVGATVAPEEGPAPAN
jgi:membrane fusion protein (multidrug efflux system)